MALIVAAFLSAYLILTSKDLSGTDENKTVLNTRDKSEMTKLSFEKGDVSLSFIKDANGIWNFADDITTPIYYAYVNNMASAVSSIEPDREVKGGDESEFGLDTPTLSVRCEYKNGTVYAVTFGDENEAVGGVYMKEAGSGKVYLVPSTTVSAFSETRETLTVPDDESEE